MYKSWSKPEKRREDILRLVRGSEVTVKPNDCILVVGTARTKYYILRNTLLQVSKFFMAALDGPFLEGNTKEIELAEEQEYVIEYFIFWLYVGSLDHEDLCVKKPAYYKLLHLYVLADKWDNEDLKNDIIGFLITVAHGANALPSATDTYIVWDGLPYDVALKKLIVDLFVCMNVWKLIDRAEDEWHPRFMRDLVVKGKRDGFDVGAPPWENNLPQICTRYHTHREGLDCGSTT